MTLVISFLTFVLIPTLVAASIAATINPASVELPAEYMIFYAAEEINEKETLKDIANLGNNLPEITEEVIEVVIEIFPEDIVEEIDINEEVELSHTQMNTIVDAKDLMHMEALQDDQIPFTFEWDNNPWDVPDVGSDESTFFHHRDTEGSYSTPPWEEGLSSW